MLSYKNARGVVSEVEFRGDGSDPAQWLAPASKDYRKAYMRTEDEETCKIAAAIEIQRVWKGYYTRTLLRRGTHSIKKKIESYSEIETVCPRFHAKYQAYLLRCQQQGLLDHGDTSHATSLDDASLHPSAVDDTSNPTSEDNNSSSLASIGNTSHTTLLDDAGLRHDTSHSTSEENIHPVSMQGYAALTIQSWWRKAHRAMQREARGIRAIGAKSMGVQVTSKKRRTRKIRDMREAATIIQRSWRRRNDIKVFQFYRELINFKRSGDPALMLKSINPKEAHLLDKAAGAYVRFRLGGVKFPPNIYYKIFTRRPILDLCACSPRDYTAMSNRLQQAKDRHNKDTRASNANDQTGWYKRQENNGWRLVSDRLFWQDPVTIETASAVTRDFHHSKLQRRQDVKKKHKQRKIEWLWKMYKEGMMVAKQELEGTSRSEVELVAEEVISLIEEREPEEVHDKDIDDLIGWTNALNFDQYIMDWHTSASSGFSDETLSIHQSEDDNYEVFIGRK